MSNVVCHAGIIRILDAATRGLVCGAGRPAQRFYRSWRIAMATLSEAALERGLANHTPRLLADASEEAILAEAIRIARRPSRAIELPRVCKAPLSL
jgi:hypothetical protein